MIKRTASLFLLLFVLNPVLAQNKNVYIDYESYLSSIVKHHPLFVKSNNIGLIGEYTYKAAKGNYDPYVSGTVENKFFNSKNYYSVVQTEVKQPLYTSQYLKAGYEYGQGNFLNPEQMTSNYGLPYVGVEASLLQGLLFDKRRYDVLKSKEYVNFQNAEKSILQNAVFFESSLNYIEWLLANQQLSLYTYFLELAEQRFKGLKELSAIGEKPGIDTLEASILYQTRLLEKQSVTIESQKKLVEVLNNLWQDANQPTSFSVNALTKDSLSVFFEKSKQVLVKQLEFTTINSNPFILQYASKQRVLELDKRYAKELIKPKLDVKYNLLSNTNTLNYFSPQFTTNNYKWGVNFSMPLFLRNARNNYKISSLYSINNQQDLDFKSNEVLLKQNLLKQNITILINQLDIAQRNSTYSKQLLDAEKLKFDIGESSLFLINTRETKWLEAELKLAEYKFKFIKAVIELIYLNGTLNYTL